MRKATAAIYEPQWTFLDETPHAAFLGLEIETDLKLSRKAYPGNGWPRISNPSKILHLEINT